MTKQSRNRSFRSLKREVQCRKDSNENGNCGYWEAERIEEKVEEFHLGRPIKK